MDINATLSLESLKNQEKELSNHDIRNWVDDEFRRNIISTRFFLMEIPTSKLAYPVKASKATEGPMVADVNRHQVGKTKSGFSPKVIVLSGHQTFVNAHAEQEPRIMAWIGDLAAEALGLQVPRQPRTYAKPRGNLTAMDKAIGINAHCACAFKAGAKYDVAALYEDFKAACNSGDYSPKMKAVSAPGWGGVTQQLKDNHPEIDNPYALSWYMDEQGYTPHVPED